MVNLRADVGPNMKQECGNHSGKPSDSDCLYRPAGACHRYTHLNWFFAPTLGIGVRTWIGLHYTRTLSQRSWDTSDVTTQSTRHNGNNWKYSVLSYRHCSLVGFIWTFYFTQHRYVQCPNKYIQGNRFKTNTCFRILSRKGFGPFTLQPPGETWQ